MPNMISQFVINGVPYTAEQLLVINGVPYTAEQLQQLQNANDTDTPSVDQPDTNPTQENVQPANGEFPDVSYVVVNGSKYSIDDEQATTDLQKLQRSVADEYNPSSTYAKGQFCLYDGYLYVSNTDIDVPEPFDQQKWDRVVLTNVLELGDKTFTHNQYMPASTWDIVHGLNKYPSVSIVDSAGTVVVADVQYIDLNKITVSLLL